MSATSSRPTCSGCSTRPASCRRSTRSSCTRGCSRRELRAFHAQHGIVTEAWSPLASGGDLLADPVITGIAQRLSRTPAQVILRWHLQLGNVVIPKSVTPSRIAENFAIFDFELEPADLAAIEGLNRDERTGPDPDTFDVGA